MRRKTWVRTAAAIVVVSVTGGVVAMSSAEQSTPAAQQTPTNTAIVERGNLSAVVFQYGTLAYRAQSDGSSYAVINQARGTYTELPVSGDTVGCGRVFYRVSDKPVLLLCGSTPAYRSLSQGDTGPDVQQLNANLVRLGYAAGLQLHPSSASFSSETAQALKRLQRKLSEAQTGSLSPGAAVFLPGALRIAKLTATLGSAARLQAPIALATSTSREVQVRLDASEQSSITVGEHAAITLPDNRITPGTVTRVGTVASTSGSGSGSSGATIPIYITLTHPKAAGRLDQAPVRVQITTARIKDALVVPVTALVGKSGGGFAVEAVRAGGRRELVAVRLGLFDDAAGLVQVTGGLSEGDRVVVPSL